MSLSSAKAKLDAQGGDPVTGYISKTDHQESYDELVDDTALTGATTAEAITVSGAAVAGTLNGRDPDDLTLGPASATDNALVRFDGTTGKVVQNSGITVDDSGNVSSNLTVSKASAVIQATATGGTAASVRVSGDAGTLRDFAFYTGANSRWFFRCDNVAESGSDAGSNFVITQKLDSGASPSYYAFTINRATGKATLGSVGATAGLELGSSGPRVMSGTGSPEGVVTAPVGSQWIDTAATTGAIKWIKAAGSGSSGWVVEYGDTGWRQLSADFLNSWSTGAEGVKIRRVGTHVVVLLSCSGASASSDTLLNVPSGFRTNTRVNTTVNSGSPTVTYAEVRDAHTILCGSRSATVRGTFSYFTTDAWPSSLPGSAA